MDISIPKLNLVASSDKLRPVMNYVFMTKKKIVSTDAHILIQMNTSILFDDSFIDGIPKEGVFISANDWKKIQSVNVKTTSIIPASWETDSTMCFGLGDTELIEAKQNVGVYPKWENVWNGVTPEPVGKIGVSLKLFGLLSRAIGANIRSSQLTFHGKKGEIKVSCSERYSVEEYGALITCRLI